MLRCEPKVPDRQCLSEPVVLAGDDQLEIQVDGVQGKGSVGV